MPTPIRLLVQPGHEPHMVHFQLAFSAAVLDDAHAWAPARLITGDGHEFDLGIVAAPTPATWHEQHLLDLTDHPYDRAARARLIWGEFSAEAEVTLTAARAAPVSAATPTVTLTLAADDQEPLRMRAELVVQGLAADQRVRLDAGVEQVYWLSGVLGDQQKGAWPLEYPKPGSYWVTVDWLDQDGFWLGNLTSQALTIADPVTGPEQTALEPLLAATAPLAAPLEIPQAANPWQPYRYARPAWNWARTCAAPGSSRIVRSLAAGVYLAITAEAWVNDDLWYRSAGQDWIPASAVTLVTPSALRGVELGEGAPPPPPPPPPPPQRRGVVTASVLNVRAQPGVAPNNPVIDRLLSGAQVSIFGETVNAGAVWYRIGEQRWVHSAWVRLLPTVQEPAQTLSAASAAAQLPVGWVVAAAINVRSGPGVNYALVGEVTHNQRLDILETRSVSGVNWHRIGADQWVYGQWVGVARGRTRPAAIHSAERWVAVSLRDQTAVAYEGDRPVYAALVATGLPGTPTVQGIFRTWLRRPGGRMAGGRPGAGYYYLEEVVWTTFFYSGYALHSAYWHDAFGRPRSHGCVNLSMYDSWWLYNWSAAGGSRSPAVVVTPT